MSILSRYVLRQHAAPALAGLAIFYFVLSMDFLVDYLNLFIAKGVPGLSVLEAFMLSLAWMTFLAVPMAVMVSVLTAFGRLSADSEITAVKASGINILTLMRPVIIAGLFVSLGLFVFGNRVLPAANHRLKTLLVDIHRIQPLATVEPGVLTELPGGYSIIVDRMDASSSEIWGVKIHRVESDQPTQTIVAERGELSVGVISDVLRIELFDGEIHEVDPADLTKYNRMLFDSHVINVEQGGTSLVRSDRSKRGDRELTLSELAERRDSHLTERAEALGTLEKMLGTAVAARLAALDGNLPAESVREIRENRAEQLRRTAGERRTVTGSSRNARKLDVEYHKKLSIPFSCLVFVLLGAPLGIRSRRGGIGIGAGIGILVFLIYYLFLVGGEQLGDRGIVTPAAAMWAPNVVFGGLGILLTLATVREWRFFSFARFIGRHRRGSVDQAPETA